MLSITVMSQSKTINLLDHPEQHFHIWKTNEFKNWVFENGILSTPGKQGDLVTNEEFGDFEFEFEFMLGKGSNSGIVYKVIEDPNNLELTQTYTSGPEYQLIDNANYHGPIKDTQKSGANYDIQPPSKLDILKPYGEWNNGRIIVKNNVVKHYLNGKLVVKYIYGDDKWKADVAKSKFADWPYAEAHLRGKIALQDHNDPVSFRKLLIKRL